MVTSLEKTQGWPETTRRCSPPLSFTVGRAAAAVVAALSFMAGDPKALQSPTATPSRRLSAPPSEALRRHRDDRQPARHRPSASPHAPWPAAAAPAPPAPVPFSSSVAPLRLAEVRQIDRRLRIEAPVEHGDQRLRHIGNDRRRRRASRATSTSRPCGRTPWSAPSSCAAACPARTRLATGWPSRSGLKEKSVSSLLSRKPSTNSREPNGPSMVVVKLTALPSPSTMLIWLVDTGSICGSGAAQPLCCLQRPRRRLAEIAIGLDELRALLQIGLAQQLRRRHRELVGIGDIAIPIGEGEPAGLGNEMHGRRRSPAPWP